MKYLATVRSLDARGWLGVAAILLAPLALVPILAGVIVLQAHVGWFGVFIVFLYAGWLIENRTRRKYRERELEIQRERARAGTQ